MVDFQRTFDFVDELKLTKSTKIGAQQIFLIQNSIYIVMCKV